MSVFIFGSHSFSLDGLQRAFLSALFAVAIAIIEGIPYGIRIFDWPFIMASIFSAAIVVLGFVKHKRIFGQVLAVSGIFLWIFLGIMALGQGG